MTQENFFFQYLHTKDLMHYVVLKCKVCGFEFNTSLQHGKFFKTLHTYKDKTLLFCVIVTQIKKLIKLPDIDVRSKRDSCGHGII